MNKLVDFYAGFKLTILSDGIEQTALLFLNIGLCLTAAATSCFRKINSLLNYKHHFSQLTINNMTFCNFKVAL